MTMLKASRLPVAYLVVLLMASLAQGQAQTFKYAIEPKEPKSGLKYKDFLSGKSSDASTLTEYCRYSMARLTAIYDSKDPKLSPVVAARNDVMNMLTTPNMPKAVRDALNKEIHDLSVRLIEGEYPAAARVNSILLLGELDDERDFKTGVRKPYGAATGSLVKLISSNTTPTYLKVPAIGAMERHIRDGWKVWNQSSKDRVQAEVLKFAAQKPNDDLDRSVNTLITRKALDSLRLMSANVAADSALAYLADPKEMPSLRASSLEYLASLDFAQFNEQQLTLYIHGLVHFLRSQSVAWYDLETNLSKRKSGAAAGGMGGMGGMGDMGSGMGGMPGGMGGDDGGLGGEDFYSGGGAGGPPGGKGGFGGFGGGNDKTKPIDSQDWQTRLARRRLNELTQLVHRALDGKRVLGDSAAATSKNHLSKDDVKIPEEFRLGKLIDYVDDYQTAMNDSQKVTNMGSLKNSVKKPIEDIMEYSNKLPGFLDRYPELKGDEEQLTETEEPKDSAPAADGSADPAKPADGSQPAEGSKAAAGDVTEPSTGDAGKL